MSITELETRLQREIQHGRFEQAEALSREVLSSQPDSIAGLQAAWMTAMWRGQFANALPHLEKLRTLRPDDVEVLGNLGLAALECGDFALSREALARMLRFDPGSVPGLLYHGLCCERLGDGEQAASSFLRAQRIAERSGIRQLPENLRGPMNHGLEFVRGWLSRSIAESLQGLKDQHGEQAVARIQASADIFTGHRPPGFSHPALRPGLAYIPDLPVRMFFEREEFPWIAQLEAATEDIRNELLNAMEADTGFKPYINHAAGTRKAEEWKELNRSTKWSSLHLYRHGERIEENCARCPRTIEVLESLDLHRVPGYSPEAMFSVLRPHAHIPEHTGSINGRLIVHLPLIVPQDCGGIRVADEQRGWQEGKCLIFDDAYRHEAWNQSDETRVVLILDTWNPALSQAEREAFSQMLQSARRFERELLDQQPV